jgi:hypothetical protein
MVVSVAAHRLTVADLSPRLALAAQNHQVWAIRSLRETLDHFTVRCLNSRLASVLVLKISK